MDEGGVGLGVADRSRRQVRVGESQAVLNGVKHLRVNASMSPSWIGFAGRGSDARDE